MPESRDRLIREDPITPLSDRRSIGDILPSRFSNVGGRNLFGTPVPLRSTTVLASRGSAMGPMAMAASRGVAMRMIGHGSRNFYGTPSIGLENTWTGRRGRGRSRNGPLPSWYPRRPLQDVSAVMNAIERRRTRLREAEPHRLASSSLQEPSVLDPTQPNPGAAPLDHDISLMSPNPTASTKDCPPTARLLPKILLDNHTARESDFLTPQKKLLISIDQVEKVVLEEFRRMKRTPTAKKAEREKKVRTLMAMR